MLAYPYGLWKPLGGIISRAPRAGHGRGGSTTLFVEGTHSISGSSKSTSSSST